MGEFFFYPTPFNPPAEARVKEDTFSNDTQKREGNVGRVKYDFQSNLLSMRIYKSHRQLDTLLGVFWDYFLKREKV